jgi:hypothetical protein
MLADSVENLDVLVGGASKSDGATKNLDMSVGVASKSVGAAEDPTAATEDAAAADFVHHLVKTHGKTANFWSFYKLYNPTHHPDLEHLAHCMLCQPDTSTKGCTTSGLNKHLQHRHREEYDSINEKGPSCGISTETEHLTAINGCYISEEGKG